MALGISSLVWDEHGAKWRVVHFYYAREMADGFLDWWEPW